MSTQTPADQLNAHGVMDTTTMTQEEIDKINTLTQAEVDCLKDIYDKIGDHSNASNSNSPFVIL